MSAASAGAAWAVDSSTKSAAVASAYAVPAAMRGPSQPTPRAIVESYHPSAAKVASPVSVLSEGGDKVGNSLDDNEECVVCYEQRWDAVLLECGHGGICYTCAAILCAGTGAEAGDPRGGNCPFCRARIEHIVRLTGSQVTCTGGELIVAVR